MSAPIPATNTGAVARLSWSATAADLSWLLLAALVLRLATYNGLFGSDDLNYLGRAIDVATGTWSSADYNGSLRYGFNIPAGLLVALFGPTPFVANLWPLLCSLLEIAAVYAMGRSVMSRRAGVLAALLLSTAPLHIAVATRVHADPVVAMFITLSFTLLWFGVVRRDAGLLFLCGLAIGGIFWAKELVAVVWLAFLPMLWLFRGRFHHVWYVIGGVLVMLALHGLLMFVIAGDPLHLVKTVLGQMQTNFIEAGRGEDAAGYYLRYLFVDIRHSGLLAVLALSALWLVPRRLRGTSAQTTGFAYVVAWALGLLIVLSIFPVSISPLRFVMKQSNYIALFLAPLAILSGMALASMRDAVARPLLACAVALGVLLGFLQQADYRAFTANSKALAAWAVENPKALVVGSTNNRKLVPRWAALAYPGQPRASILAFRDVHEAPEKYEAFRSASEGHYVVLDRQTMLWGAGPSPVTSPLPCWEPVARLEPVGLAWGNHLAGALGRAAFTLARWGVPGLSAVGATFERLGTPRSADLYRVVSGDVLCRRGP